MKWLLLPVCVALLAATPPAKPAATTTTESLEKSGPLVVGTEAPWFSGWTPDDQVINRDRLLKAAPNGVALVVFATWCAPCVEGLKRLAAGRDALEAAGVRPVLVAYREEAEVVTPWLAARGWKDTTVLIDRFGVAATALGVVTQSKEGERARLPRTVVVSGDGTVRAIFGREGDDYVERIVAAVGRGGAPK